MGILDQLVEKKDILIYCDSRIAQLEKEKENMLKITPDKDKQYALKVMEGRIRELKQLKKVAHGNHIKKMCKKQWRDAYK